MGAETVSIDPENHQQRLIRKGAEVIKAGGLVAYPTETFYALGADALNERAVEKVYHVKGRSFHKALTVIIDREESLGSLVANVPPEAEKIIARFWPGPLTIILEASPHVPAILTAGSGKVGVRISSSPFATSLASAAGCPLTATSANPSGLDAFTRAEDISSHLRDKVDLILNCGETPGGPPSSLLDMTASPPLIMRAGAVSREMIEECLQLRIEEA